MLAVLLKSNWHAASDSSVPERLRSSFRMFFLHRRRQHARRRRRQTYSRCADFRGVPTPLDDWTTTAANADDQEQVVVPVRARSLPAGKPLVKMVPDHGWNCSQWTIPDHLSGGLRSTDDPATLL